MNEAVSLLHDYLHASARRLPDKVALVAGAGRHTYAELEARSNALAHALVRRGVQRGDRVVLFLDNSVEAVVAFWGALKANAVVSMVHPQTKAAKLAYILGDLRARALVTAASHSAVFATAASHSAHLETVVVAGFDPARHAFVRGACAWDDALGEGPADRPPTRRCIDVDLAAVLYTSGSTGEPKGVMLTHRNMCAAAASISAYLENAESDVLLGCLPMSFGYGLSQMTTAFRSGARLVLEKGFAYPAQILEVMARERVTGFAGVPTIFAKLTETNGVRDHDLTSLRYLTNAAAALPEKHLVALRTLIPGARLYSMYGQTECTRCSYLPPGDVARKPTSIGVAIPNTELWLVDAQDRRVGPGVVGELVVRGATVMRGYWGRPEETAKKLRPGPIPGEQVLYTGDLCRTDEEGYLHFVGRTDDIFKSRGEKVAPKEVEAVLHQADGVVECAVVGVPDAALGAAIKAFVVLEEGRPFDERALRRFCQERLESFMVPTLFEPRTSLPRTANGKIDKKELRA